jgi:hypothetical protein
VTSPRLIRIVSSIAVGVLLTAGFTATSLSASASTATQPTDVNAGLGVQDGTIKDGAIAFTGSLVEIADLPGKADPAARQFHVPGLGYLVIDATGVPQEARRAEFTAWFTLPADIDTTVSLDETFRSLATYSASLKPLVAQFATVVDDEQSSGIGQLTDIDSMINRAPVSTVTQKIYAVAVTPSNVAGSSAATSQSLANIQTAVDSASSFWSSQSGGKITFSLVGKTTWYKSTTPCNGDTDGNTSILWDEAANAAYSQLGYRDSANSHLVLFFPSGTNCGGALGIGSIGESVNSGGRLWTIGSTSTPDEYSTLHHELGHNLSYGHADYADCGTSPAPGLSGSNGCGVTEYGDITDTMGFSFSGKSGGAISSPNAIRSGIWDTTAYKVAPMGTTTSYTLASVSDHAGLRAVVVEDSQGYDYFVEYRNASNEDAQFASIACASPSYCNSTYNGVRIMRLSNNGYYKGYRGDHSIVIGHTASGVKQTEYAQGETFTTNGMTISVTNTSASSATVSVTRPTVSLSSDRVWMLRTVNASDTDIYNIHVGDTWTAMVGSWWNADSYAFQWYRSGKAISGATKQSYVVSSSDKGKGLKVRVIGKLGSKTKTAYDPVYYSGYSVYGGIMTAGSVSIDYSATPLVATPKAWTVPGVTLKYQWYRNGSAISGATKSTYTPTTSDRDKTFTVKLSASKSGYNSASATSAATPDLTIDSSGTPVVSGTPEVGQTLSVNTLSYTYPGGGAVASPTRTYQWYRSGSAISGAVGSTYTLTSSDYAKTMSVRVLGSVAGYIPHTATSASTAKVAHGTFHGTLAAPIVTETDLASRTLTAALAPGSVTETPISLYYQWYRGTSAISKATKSTYKLTSSDYAKDIKVKVTVKKSSYTSIVLYSVPAGYSLIPSATPPVISGTLAIGQTISVTPVTTTLNGSSASPSYTYRWYRSGKAISGATSNTYTLVPADAGKTIKVLVTSSLTGALGWSKSSASTAVIGSSTVPMAGWNAQANATVSVPTASRVLSVTGTGITEAGVKQTYQWYRGTAAISKATKSSYTLTSSDTNKLISVRVITSKATFTSITKTSVPTNYTVVGSTVPQISDTTPAVGDTLSIIMPTYTVLGSPYTLTGSNVTYRWYRSGVAISGATADTYVVTTADKSKTLKVKVTVTAPGYLTSTLSSTSTSKATS